MSVQACCRPDFQNEKEAVPKVVVVVVRSV
jgi:hypothetical protein